MNNKKIYITLAILVFAFGVVLYIKNNSKHTTNMVKSDTMKNTASVPERQFEPLKKAEAGDLILVNYTGKLADGTVFDSSIPKGQPFGFLLGRQMVIKGWDEGLMGVERGDKKTLVISPDKAYGDDGLKKADGKVVIPGNATLTFDIEVVEVVAKAKVEEMIAKQQVEQLEASKNTSATKKQ